MTRVLLGISGGIAAYKAPELVRELVRAGCEARVAATPSALEFVSALSLQAVSGSAVRSELFALSQESEISHIELADWADSVLIAPASANTLARLAHGLADDLLSTICMATRAPLVVAPAMNVNMYRHPATQQNLDLLQKRGVQVVGPDAGELACGWEGEGRLVDLPRLVAAATQAGRRPDLSGEVVLVTAGPTAEPIDPVRILTNRSSGKMGFALAEVSAQRGAEVILVSGPVALPTPHGVHRIDVETAEEMARAVEDAFERATVVIKTAAVSDYRVGNPAPEKIKRQEREQLSLELVRNRDILANLGPRKGSRVVIGFAAETHNVLSFAQSKLQSKGCDLIVANDVSRADIGFNADRNEVIVVGPQASEVRRIPLALKHEIAERILDRVCELRT